MAADHIGRRATFAGSQAIAPRFSIAWRGRHPLRKGWHTVCVSFLLFVASHQSFLLFFFIDNNTSRTQHE
jgi:hypothetical protein